MHKLLMLAALLGACEAPGNCGALGCTDLDASFDGRPSFETRDRLRLATWNLRWLAGEPGQGEVPRSDADLARLRAYARRLNADVIALQEVADERAARRVFDPRHYQVHISGRPAPQRTGFAYRRGLPVTPHPDYRALAVGGSRNGAQLTVHLPDGRPLRLLSVHLASGCFEGEVDRDTPACRRLAAQRAPLEAWIDARAREGVPAVVLGDFNRRFFGEPGGESVWRGLDDGRPAGLELESPTETAGKPTCWDGRYPEFIDHLVLVGAARDMQVVGSFREHTYDVRDRRHRRALSDHCPLSLLLRL